MLRHNSRLGVSQLQSSSIPFPPQTPAMATLSRHQVPESDYRLDRRLNEFACTPQMIMAIKDQIIKKWIRHHPFLALILIGIIFIYIGAHRGFYNGVYILVGFIFILNLLMWLPQRLFSRYCPISVFFLNSGNPASSDWPLFASRDDGLASSSKLVLRTGDILLVGDPSMSPIRWIVKPSVWVGVAMIINADEIEPIRKDLGMDIDHNLRVSNSQMNATSMSLYVYDTIFGVVSVMPLHKWLEKLAQNRIDFVFVRKVDRPHNFFANNLQRLMNFQKWFHEVASTKRPFQNSKNTLRSRELGRPVESPAALVAGSLYELNLFQPIHESQLYTCDMWLSYFTTEDFSIEGDVSTGAPKSSDVVVWGPGVRWGDTLQLSTREPVWYPHRRFVRDFLRKMKSNKNGALFLVLMKIVVPFLIIWITYSIFL